MIEKWPRGLRDKIAKFLVRDPNISHEQVELSTDLLMRRIDERIRERAEIKARLRERLLGA